MAVYGGIDFSMTCPAITIGSSSDFSKCKSFFYTDKKKFEGNLGHDIFGMMMIPYENEMERYGNISDWAMAIMRKFNVSEVCIEGYSMGSKGNVFNIGENTGILKYNLWKAGIKYHTVAPTQAKKHFSGKGNANKCAMHDAFEEKTGISIVDMLGVGADKNPVSDVVDSYAMLNYGLENYF